MQTTFKEIFKSPYEKDTYDDARKVLDEIRAVHSLKNGWTEIDAYIESLPNGKFRAVIIHQKVL